MRQRLVVRAIHVGGDRLAGVFTTLLTPLVHGCWSPALSSSSQSGSQAGLRHGRRGGGRHDPTCSAVDGHPQIGNRDYLCEPVGGPCQPTSCDARRFTPPGFISRSASSGVPPGDSEASCRRRLSRRRQRCQPLVITRFNPSHRRHGGTRRVPSRQQLRQDAPVGCCVRRPR